jgi:hypothetical protein
MLLIVTGREARQKIIDNGTTKFGDGCPVEMFDHSRCGRAIHHAPPGGIPVCFMHFRDASKDNARFQTELDLILEKAGNGIADFSGFVFPRWTRRGAITPKCIFNQATFLQPATFFGVTFVQPAIFSEAVFVSESAFFGAEFREDAVFAWATFGGNADFTRAIFAKLANFFAARFFGRVDFRETVFPGDPRMVGIGVPTHGPIVWRAETNPKRMSMPYPGSFSVQPTLKSRRPSRSTRPIWAEPFSTIAMSQVSRSPTLSGLNVRACLREWCLTRWSTLSITPQKP